MGEEEVGVDGEEEEEEVSVKVLFSQLKRWKTLKIHMEKK